MFGYNLVGGIGSPTPTVHTNNMTSSDDLGIFAAGGDWLYDADETNSQDDDNWIMMVRPYDAANYGATPIAYDTSDHTLSEGSDWVLYNQGGNSHSGGGMQLSLDRAFWGMRSSTSGFTAKNYMADLANDLGSFTNNVAVTTQTERYSGGNRLNDTTGIFYAAANSAQQIIGTYNGGSTTTIAATLGDGAAQYMWDFSSPGGGTEYANLGTANTWVYLNTNNSSTFAEGTTRLDMNHCVWDGSAGTDVTKVDRDSVVTLPTHTGSTLSPTILATTWGNILIHFDTSNPGNSVVYPVTWSGTSPTIGSAVPWAGGTQIPSHECYLKGLDGCGFTNYNNGTKYQCGQDRSGRNVDLYRTCRIYISGSDLKLDTIDIDFSKPNGEHTLRVRHREVVTFSSTTDVSVWPLFMANNRDLGIWHKDTGKFHYIENAYY